MSRKRKDIRLSGEMERYLDESVKRHQDNLSQKAEIVKKQYAPIVAKLRCHSLSKRLGLDFEEPILSLLPTNMLSKEDKELYNELDPFYVIHLPIILDEITWKCKPRIRSKDMGFTPYRIDLNDDDAQNGSVSVKVSRDGISRADFIESFSIDTRILGLPVILETVDFELVISFDSQGLNIVTNLSTDRLFAGKIDRVQSHGAYPVLKIRSQDAENYVFAPIYMPDRTQQWRRSYKEEENKLIGELDGREDGIRCKVERILQYASRWGSSSPLAILDSHVYTNVVLHTGHDPQWKKNDLSFAFRNTLAYLEACLHGGVLDSYFEPEHNLLAMVPQSVLDDLLRCLKTTKDMNGYDKLLC